MADGFDKEALDVAHKINDAFVKPYYGVAQRTSAVQIIVREALQEAFSAGRLSQRTDAYHGKRVK